MNKEFSSKFVKINPRDSFKCIEMQSKGKSILSEARNSEFIVFLFGNQERDDAGAAEDDEGGHDDHQELLEAAPPLPKAGGPHPVAMGEYSSKK